MIFPVPNGRYRMLLHHLSSYRNYKGKLLFHDIPYYGLISCSAQTHLDVTEDELIRVINVFNRLEPLKALLFANSPYEGGYLCVRDHLWRESMHGLNPHNVDGFDIELGSVEELVSYIKSMSLYCLERDDRYINFTPLPLDEYFSSSSVEGEYFDGNDYRTISWEPRVEDLEYLRSFKFVDLTFRGTVELRSTCMQPISEALGVPAFNLGLKVNLDKLEKLLDTEGNIYRQGYNVIELRKLFVMRKLPAFAEEEGVRDLLLKVLDIARDGLISRGYGEERFLESHRIDRNGNFAGTPHPFPGNKYIDRDYSEDQIEINTPPEIDADQVQAIQNYKNAAGYDWNISNITDINGSVRSLEAQLGSILEEMMEFYAEDSPQIKGILEYQYSKVVSAENRYAFRVRDKFERDYIREGIRLAINKQEKANV